MANMEKKYRCGTCNAEFDTQEALDKHVRDQHKPAPTPSSPERREAPTPNR